MAKTIDGKSYSWTQPCCPDCYGRTSPGQAPATLNDRVGETCCYCGHLTGAGIYVRVDPAAVPHPTPEPSNEA